MATKKKSATPRNVTFSITEVTIHTGKTASLRFRVDGEEVTVNVPAELKAYFSEQFVRPNPTSAQKKRYATLMKLLEAAYKKGREDAGN